ncbi:DM13 domain-containing protein [Ancylomarina sp. 16SWW S1-10-2]|uniref:DM13 domain-containing protein n=1 Tax=Ancylomarina sp. 16SWW S1-10-2 TaxID=2499681 RepID=UPI0012AE2C66|nr:DM13 domain-containing protein [Ancylomarina sp. 16SWW S1-10-2]MRT92366.1 hypothetical protein [Ancylomarina sp. 16SWW S1-10-2]
MKNWYMILILILAVSCSSEDDKMDELEETLEMEMKLGEEATEDNFVSDAHETTGTASLNEDETLLIFTDFKTDNGPLLEVYLSTDKAASEYVSLGDLKGIEGDFEYSIPSGTDLTKYKYVLIWCVDFSVSFGHAELK